MASRHKHLGAQIDAETAQLVVARIASGLGSRDEWDSSMLEWIAMLVNRALPADVPACDDTTEAAVTYWRVVAGLEEPGAAEEEVCRFEGCRNTVPDAGDGWDGYCTSCADRLASTD